MYTNWSLYIEGDSLYTSWPLCIKGDNPYTEQFIPIGIHANTHLGKKKRPPPSDAHVARAPQMWPLLQKRHIILRSLLIARPPPRDAHICGRIHICDAP